MQNIINPLDNKAYSIITKQGINTIKNYINYFNLQNGGVRKNYFLKDNMLTDQQKKFCRCALQVATKNKVLCNKKRKWLENIDKCYNPYSVCSKNVGTSTGGKPCFYNFLNKNIPDDELVSYSYIYYDSINDWAKANKQPNLDTCIKLKNKDKLRTLLNNWYLKKRMNVKTKKKN